MTSKVAPKVKGRVIMKVSIMASGLMPTNSRLKPRTMTTKASRHTQPIAAYLETRLVKANPHSTRRLRPALVNCAAVESQTFRPAARRVDRPDLINARLGNFSPSDLPLAFRLRSAMIFVLECSPERLRCILG